MLRRWRRQRRWRRRRHLQRPELSNDTGHQWLVQEAMAPPLPPPPPPPTPPLPPTQGQPRASVRTERCGGARADLREVVSRCGTTTVASQAGRPRWGGRPVRALGSLFKDPGSKRQDAHTHLVWAAKTSRKHDTALCGSTFTCLPRGFGTALLSRSDIPTGPRPSTLRRTLYIRPKTRAKRGPHPPPGRAQDQIKTRQQESPRRGWDAPSTSDKNPHNEKNRARVRP